MSRYSTSHKKLYALYDREEANVFNGTAEECAEFTGCTMNAFRSALCRPWVHIGRKYTVHKMDDEAVTYLTCKMCGKEKKVEAFKYKYYDGRYHLTRNCLRCYNMKASEYQRGKYESHKKQHQRD